MNINSSMFQYLGPPSINWAWPKYQLTYPQCHGLSTNNFSKKLWLQGALTFWYIHIQKNFKSNLVCSFVPNQTPTSNSNRGDPSRGPGVRWSAPLKYKPRTLPPLPSSSTRSLKNHNEKEKKIKKISLALSSHLYIQVSRQRLLSILLSLQYALSLSKSPSPSPNHFLSLKVSLSLSPFLWLFNLGLHKPYDE